MTKLTKFYKNEMPNDDGLFLQDLWNFSDWELENKHHFIQWMFPIELKSNHCDNAPVVTGEDLVESSKDEEIKANILKSLNVIENFLGLDIAHKNHNFQRPQGFQKYDDKNWLTPYNHNYIRISRIIHSLVLFGLTEEANELFSYLEDKVYSSNRHMIGEHVHNEWKFALNRTVGKEIKAA